MCLLPFSLVSLFTLLFKNVSSLPRRSVRIFPFLFALAVLLLVLLLLLSLCFRLGRPPSAATRKKMLFPFSFFFLSINSCFSFPSYFCYLFYFCVLFSPFLHASSIPLRIPCPSSTFVAPLIIMLFNRLIVFSLSLPIFLLFYFSCPELLRYLLILSFLF